MTDADRRADLVGELAAQCQELQARLHAALAKLEQDDGPTGVGAPVGPDRSS